MARSSASGIVELRAGRVQGRRHDGVWAYLGVPYARAPVGPLRWHPPEAPEPWSGVRRATEPGPIAPQPPPVPGMSVPGDPTEQAEDCLSLNLWTPGLDDRRRPVMVWIHGGAFTGGTGSSLLYRGDLLASEQDVVVVTCNYRLGALGFLSHPALAVPGGTLGNWGLLDQVAVLEWVRDHVAAFGGDPANVTVFGESAGSMSVAALLTMPRARGLLHRAVLQSGPPYVQAASGAAAVADDVARVLGLPAVDRETLEGVPAADLVAAVAQLQAQLQDGPPDPGRLPLVLSPVVDEASLPVQPDTAVAAGRAAGVSLLVGTTRDELSFFVMADPAQAKMGDDGLRRALARSAPDVPPDRVVAAYRRARAARGEPTSPIHLWIAAGTDLVFRWPSLRLAAAHARHQPRTYVYLFTWETPAFGGMLGSCHALDIPFVFGTVRHRAVAQFSGGGPEAEALSADMRAAWAAFARRGDPSHDGLGSWPAWDPLGQATMVLGPSRGVQDAPRSEELAVWAETAPLATPIAGVDGVGGGGTASGAAADETDGAPTRPAATMEATGTVAGRPGRAAGTPPASGT